MTRVAVHVVPHAGVDRDQADGRGHSRNGIQAAAMLLVDRYSDPADLLIVAVPAGRGPDLAKQLFADHQRSDPS